MPAVAVRSPAARRSISLMGQPIKTAQPTMSRTPATSRTKGALPPRLRNSRPATALAQARCVSGMPA